MKTAHDHYVAAVALRNRIVAGESNEPRALAWAAVARQCAIANDKRRAEIGSRPHGRADQSFFNNLDAVNWTASAVLETIAREARA